ncbi:MAG: PAS domain S-box protein [Promethearchaeota archaeon]
MSDIIENLLNLFPDLVIITDLKGQIKDLSQSVLDLYAKREKKEFIDKHILEFIHPEYRELAKKSFKDSQGSENLKDLELKFLLDDDSCFFGQLTSILIKNENHKPQYFLTIIKNVTETKKMMDELRRSKEMFQLVLDNIPQFIFWKDQDSKFLGCNNNFARVAGVGDPENIVGKLDEDLVWKKEEAESFFEIDRYVMESNEPEYHIIESQLQADGKEAWLDTNKIPLHDSEGNVIGLLGTYEDITDRINAERALRKSERSYRDAYNRANFLRDLFSHDMNNILQGIQSGTELIEMYQDSKNESGIYRILRVIFNEIKRGIRLIKNIRTFSQLEEISENIYPIEVNELLIISKNKILKSYQHKNINIKIDSLRDNIFVKANEFLLEVFQNLLINAVVFNDNPEIEINIIISEEPQDKKLFVKIQFSDNGVGVEDDRKEIIFQRTENMDKQITGLGLGLSLSKKVMENYKGKIWVEDRVSGNHKEGSNFIILIPQTEK